ncbi:MAG: adenosylmethionine--8-amino-7-oxononanoate transaminase [Phycisphaerae bacterium]|nr:adenosylmethionine--8-amino-7-oxononanoate transaminase [Phycisphaerae bacterium]
MKPEQINNLIAFDKKHIWHPYTSMTNPLPAIPVVAAQGCELELADGRKLIDGMSSWWCAIHGYNHPELNAAAKTQIDKMSHVMFGGITHPSAVTLAEKLLAITPEPLQHIFFADSGSVSVEVAIKMALQYHHASGNKSKRRLLTVRKGYHGDTFAAMSVCDPVTGMHQIFADVVTKQYFAEQPTCRFDQPYDPQSITDIQRQLELYHENIAAVIIEPVVQGAGGMWFYHGDYLKDLRRLCDEYNVLLIFDEIATGFGRSGKLFACQWPDISPDIMCVGKSLTAGYMTLVAVLATTKVAHGISADSGVFMHGPTFMANPLACAVAIANLEILEQNRWPAQVENIKKLLTEGLEPCKTIPGVKDVRTLGAIGVVETENPVNVAKLQEFFVKNNVWIRPFNNLIYLMPPYIITNDQLNYLTEVIQKALQANLHQ